MLDRGMKVVEAAHRMQVPMAFGTDLIGAMHRRQSEEFELRADLVPPLALLRAATINGAKLIRRERELGSVTVGHQADLIAVDGNPLENIRLLADPACAFKLVLKGGQIVKNDVLH